MDAPVTHHEVDRKAEEQFKKNWWKHVLGFLFILAIPSAFILGNNHVVQSSHGTKLVPKVHFTFAETFVSLDAITGQPFVTAKAQNPLAVKALQREGILESDDAFQLRMERETRAKLGL